MGPLAILGRRHVKLVAALLAVGVLGLVPRGDARAEPQAPPIVSPDVLELMGLSAEHALVLGVRLPMTPRRFFGGATLEAMGELVASAFEQNRQEFEDELRDIPIDITAIALAITLDPGGSSDGWTVLSDERLTLDEVTLLLCLDGDRGVVFGIAGALFVADKRLAVAMTLHQEPSFSLSNYLKSVKDRLIAAAKAKAKGTAQGAAKKAKSVLWPEPPPPATNPTTGGSQASGPPPSQGGSPDAGAREDGHVAGPMGPQPKPPTNATTGAPKSPEMHDEEIVSVEPEAPAGATNPTTGAPKSPKTDDGELESIDGKPVPPARHRILTLAGRFDGQFSLGDFRELFRNWGLPLPLEGHVSDDALVFERLVLAFEIDVTARRLAAASLLGTLELGTGGVPFHGLLSFRRPAKGAPAGARWRALLGVDYESTTLKQVLRSLDGHWIGDIWVPSMGLVYASQDVELPFWEMNPVEKYFFEPIYSPGDTDFLPILDVAKFHKGFNFIGPIRFGALLGVAKNVAGLLWANKAEGDEPSVAGDSSTGTRASGVDEGDGPMLMLTGNPGIGLPGLSLPEMPSLKDMSLRAQLPPLRPKGAPAWFVRGDLYAELTGRPSFALGGSMTVRVEDDELQFFVEGEIARDGLGASVSVAGGLASEAGWSSPFGIDWLTIRKAVLKLSVNTLGNVGLGFAGDVTVGTKDVAVAVALAINAATGVPTNLVLYGESEQGVALEDVVLLQQAIAKHAGRPGPPIRLNRLPDAAVRNLKLLFAPKDEPQLGVEAGFGISGDLWIEPKRGESLQRVGTIDLALDRSGLRGHGFVAGYGLGPVEWSDAEVHLALTLQEQRLALSGMATILGKSRSLEVKLTGRGMLDDFLEAHGAALGKGADAAKERLEDLREAAQAKAEKIRSVGPILQGRRKPLLPKPLSPRR